MVRFEEDPVAQTCVCYSDKVTTALTIKKSNDGYIFFEIFSDKGMVPKELQGKFSSVGSAKRSVEEYMRKKLPSTAAKYKARHGTKSNTEGI